jgi:hypothetical protein
MKTLKTAYQDYVAIQTKFFLGVAKIQKLTLEELTPEQRKASMMHMVSELTTAHNKVSEQLTSTIKYLKDQSMSEKPEMSRLCRFFPVLSDVVFVLEYGEEKHKDNLNWKSYPVSKDTDAALRHIFLGFTEGLDPETGKHHFIHAICRLLFAIQKIKEGHVL